MNKCDCYCEDIKIENIEVNGFKFIKEKSYE